MKEIFKNIFEIIEEFYWGILGILFIIFLIISLVSWYNYDMPNTIVTCSESQQIILNEKIDTCKTFDHPHSYSGCLDDLKETICTTRVIK